MKYFNKKNKKPVVLTPSKGQFLVKLMEGFQGESLVRRLSQAERLISAKWVPSDFLTVVTFEEEGIRSTSFKNTLNTIKEDESVEDVIPVFMDEEGFQRLIVPGRLLAAYKPGTKEALTTALTGNEFKVIENSRYGNWIIVGLPEKMKIKDAIIYFNNIQEVDYSEPVYYGVNDAEEVSVAALKWNLESINLTDAWNITTGMDEILVAVIDGRPDINHPAIKQSFEEELSDEWDFSGANTLSSHSTQIVSIFVAKGNEVKGISPGVWMAPIIVKLESQYYYQRAESIHYLTEILKKGELNNRKITKVIANCSWKTSGDVGVIREAIETAASSGVIFVTSAGNDSSSGPHYPSDYSKTIKGVFSVAALAPNNRKAEYSNYSTAVSISAPGGAGLPFDVDDIYCADLNNTNSYTAGTSFAAPHLASTIALMLSVNQQMTIDEIKNTLEQTSVSIKEENPEFWPLLGVGKLNTGEAVKEASKARVTSVPYVETARPTEPSVPEPAKPITEPETPSESAASGPKINVTLNTDAPNGALNKEAFITEIVDMVREELHQKSAGWQDGASIRITIESEGTSVILEYRI